MLNGFPNQVTHHHDVGRKTILYCVWKRKISFTRFGTTRTAKSGLLPSSSRGRKWNKEAPIAMLVVFPFCILSSVWRSRSSLLSLSSGNRHDAMSKSATRAHHLRVWSHSIGESPPIRCRVSDQTQKRNSTSMQDVRIFVTYGKATPQQSISH